MTVDPDHPGTWREWKKELCISCRANCCRMPVEVLPSDLIRMGLCLEFDFELGEKHILRSKKKFIKSYSKKTGKYTLHQLANKDCLFLDANRRCTIYLLRPDTCRHFPQVGARPGYCAYEKK
jgi:Fe-S-cluster containining protein